MCARCGTPIADTALICFRCGTGTVAPARHPAVPRRRRWMLATLSLAVLVSAGLSLGSVVTHGLPSPFAWGVGALALIGLIWSLVPR